MFLCARMRNYYTSYSLESERLLQLPATQPRNPVAIFHKAASLISAGCTSLRISGLYKGANEGCGRMYNTCRSPHQMLGERDSCHSHDRNATKITPGAAPSFDAEVKRDVNDGRHAFIPWILAVHLKQPQIHQCNSSMLY